MTEADDTARPPAPRRWGQHAGALLIYAALALSLLWPAIHGDQVVSAGARWARFGPFAASQRALVAPGIDILGDSANAYVPYLRYAADCFAADRRIPLWKTTACCGAPFVGNGESAVFFPTNLIAILLGAPDWIHAAQVFVKLLAGAFGAYLLARHLGLSYLASLLVGLTFGIGGFQMVFLLYTPTSVALLLPLLLLAVDRAVQRPTLPRFCAVALVAGLQHLAGHPETTMHCHAAGFALGCVRLLSLRSALGMRVVLRRAASLAAAFVAGAALGAVQILPLTEYIRESDTLLLRDRRLLLPAVEHPWYSALFAAGLVAGVFAFVRLARGGRRLWLWALLLFVAVLGGLIAGLAAGMAGTFVLPLSSDWFGTIRDYVGPENYLERNGAFVGAALVLAVVGLLFGRPRGVARTAGVLAGIGLLVGFRAPGAFGALQLLPLFRIAENTRLLLMALLATALLAGLGLDALGQLARQQAARARLVLAGLVPALAAVLALAIGVRLGLFPRLNVPSCPPEVTTVEAQLLPLEIEGLLRPPGFPPVPGAEPVSDAASSPAASAAAPEPSGPLREFLGEVRLPEPPLAIRLLYSSRNLSVPASWIARSAADPDEPPPETPVLRHYLFRGFIPESELPPGRNALRLRISLPEGRIAWSELLNEPDTGRPDLLPFPAQPMPGRSITQLQHLLVAGVLVLLLLHARGATLVIGRFALALLVGASLWFFAAPTIPLLPSAFFYPPSPALELLAQLPPDSRMLTMHPQNFPAEIPTLYGIPDVRGYDALYPARVIALLREATDVKPRFTSMELLPARQDPDLNLLGLMAVRAITDWEQRPPGMRRLRYTDEDLLPKTDPFPIVLNPAYLPRARLVTGAAVEPDDARALGLLAAPEFPRGSTVVLASGEPRPPSDRPPPLPFIIKSRPELVRIEIRPDEAGWLVLADTFFPGWRVLVDGQERELLRANVAFRAVVVGPGDHLVEFRYEPLWYRVGAVTSALAGAAMLCACMALPLLRRRRLPPRPA